MTRVPLAFAVTTLVMAGGVAGATVALDRPAPRAAAVARASVVTVSDATRVCPDPSGIPNRELTSVAVATSGSARPSPSGVTSIPLGGRPRGLLPRTGGVAGHVRDDAARPVTIAAAGPLAAGLEAVQRSRTDDGPARGLAATRCVAPGTRFTFLGVATEVGDDPRLVLTNVGDVPALVDVSLAADTGPLPSTSAQGVRVAPRAQVTLRLVGVAPNHDALAVSVLARTGHVAAALRDARRNGDLPRGVDWVPPTAAAARELVVPGLTKHSGSQQLVLLDPGPAAASAQVEVVDGDGAAVPTGLDAVDVRPGAVSVVDIGDAVGGRPVALRITADRPLQAGLVTTLPGANGFADTAYKAAVRPVTDAVVPLPGSVGGATQAAALQLAAPRAAVDLRVVPLGTDPSGSDARTPVHVHVPAGTVRVVDPAAAFGGAAPRAIEVEAAPGSGPVYAAVTWYEQGRRGPLVTSVPVVAEPRVMVRAATRSDPLAALDRR